ncbi:MAG: collagen binding domain-containing protein [Kofleriaceae bacterium]
MRRRWGLTWIALCATAGTAASQPTSDGETASVDAGSVSEAAEATGAGTESSPLVTLGKQAGNGYAGMPGGLTVPSAGLIAKRHFSVIGLAGFGWRTSLLGPDHRFARGFGDLGVAYGATEFLTVAIALDGRYDRHYGLAPPGEHGLVGDPRLFARAARPMGKLTLGGQLSIWFPGNNAPSITPSAISAEARVLASLTAGPATISLNGGFRLDNSVNSVEEQGNLSIQDQVSLGASEFHAVVAGARAAIPAGKLLIGIEASMDLFVGSGALGPILRAGGSVELPINERWSALAFVGMSKVPKPEISVVTTSEGMQTFVTLVPYEPTISGGLGIHATFGGSKSTTQQQRSNEPVIVTADISGVVVDDAGKPIAGAKVRLTLPSGAVQETTTDDKGRYTLKGVAIGKTVNGQTTLDDASGELSIEAAGKKPRSQKLTLTRGTNSIAQIGVETIIPPGQIRGQVRAASSGASLAGATITVQPGELKIEAEADGTFTLDLPPGTYKVTVSKPGFTTQSHDIELRANGLVNEIFDLRRQ